MPIPKHRLAGLWSFFEAPSCLDRCLDRLRPLAFTPIDFESETDRILVNTAKNGYKHLFSGHVAVTFSGYQIVTGRFSKQIQGIVGSARDSGRLQTGQVGRGGQ